MSSIDLDAVTASPRHHRLAFEDDRVRVLETIVLAGETTEVHTHAFPAMLYVISGSEFVRRDAEGAVMVDSRSAGIRLQPGQALWTGPLGPHSLENVGEQPIHIIATEMKL